VRKFGGWWLNQCATRPVDLISGWVAFFWALDLLPDPAPVARVHQYMEQLLPLWAYGAVALLVFTSYWLSNSLSFVTVGDWKRHHAHMFACGFWSFVFVSFFSSGGSLTGQGTYFVLAVATGIHSLVLYTGEPHDWLD